VEEIGRTRPTIVAELMEEANKFTDGEDVHQKSTEQVDIGDDTVAGITKEGEIW
jgi:hypothetical protein